MGCTVRGRTALLMMIQVTAEQVTVIAMRKVATGPINRILATVPMDV